MVNLTLCVYLVFSDVKILLNVISIYNDKAYFLPRLKTTLENKHKNLLMGPNDSKPLGFKTTDCSSLLGF